MTVYTASNVNIVNGLFILNSSKVSFCFRVAQISSVRKEIFSVTGTWELTVWLTCGKKLRFEFDCIADAEGVYQRLLQAMTA